MGRYLVGCLTFSFVAGLFLLTVLVVVRSGVTAMVVVAVVVLLVLVLGALGAMGERR